MIELIGIIASLFVLVCFTFDDEKKIRIFDGVGALLYVVYGILIGSISNVFMNTVLVGIQIYKLYKLKRGNKWQDHQKQING